MRRGVPLFLALGTLVLLLACVPLVTPTAAPPPAATPTVAPAPTPTPVVAKPKTGGTLRAIAQASLPALDPIWSFAYVTAVSSKHWYDTLLARDGAFAPQPQMLQEWKVSPDGKTYTFTLREGLVFHDGTPVTPDDVMASITRWATKGGSAGSRLWPFVAGMKAVDARTFTMELKEPVGIVIDVLAALGPGYVAVMKKEQAATSPDEKVTKIVGSGPYKYVSWEPGHRLVLERFTGYRPRADAPSAHAGAMNAYLDRIEYLEIPDPATRVSGLETGEWDFVDGVAMDIYGRIKGHGALDVYMHKPGNMPTIVFNKWSGISTNVKFRQAVLAAADAEAVMATYGPKELWMLCPAIFYCGAGAPYESGVGKEFYNQKNPTRAKELAKEAGYAGEPIILPQPMDYPTIHPIASVTKSFLEAAGFKVDLKAVDWATLIALVAKKEGWHIYPTWFASWGGFHPLMNLAVATGFRGYTSPQMDELRDKFARAITVEEKKRIVDQIQALYYEEAPGVHFGQFYPIHGARKWVKGYDPRMVLPAFWNVWLDR